MSASVDSETASVLEFLNIADFDGSNVYVLMAIARKKDNDSITTNSEPVFREVARDKETFHRRYDRLHRLISYRPETFRLYATLNPRDSLSGVRLFQKRLNDWMYHYSRGDGGVARKFQRLDKEWYSILQKPEVAEKRYFLWDLDSTDTNKINHLMDRLPGDKVQYGTRTPNGWHAVTETFNYTDYDIDDSVELKTDGLVHLTCE